MDLNIHISGQWLCNVPSKDCIVCTIHPLRGSKATINTDISANLIDNPIGMQDLQICKCVPIGRFDSGFKWHSFQFRHLFLFLFENNAIFSEQYILPEMNKCSKPTLLGPKKKM
jgi:hypothetical protein